MSESERCIATFIGCACVYKTEREGKEKWSMWLNTFRNCTVDLLENRDMREKGRTHTMNVTPFVGNKQTPNFEAESNTNVFGRTGWLNESERHQATLDWACHQSIQQWTDLKGMLLLEMSSYFQQAALTCSVWWPQDFKRVRRKVWRLQTLRVKTLAGITLAASW